MIQCFNKEKPTLEHYDVLIIDEYQDIEQELAELLEYIKFSNPQIQIIAVGDMAQKIYDKTTLNVLEFIEQFLGEHIKLEFTKCFRLSAPLAKELGDIWEKKIIGVNDNCIVEKMSISQVVDFLSNQMPQDILCLGARQGKLSDVLNRLESDFPEKFNKKTVYASISDKDSVRGTEPKRGSAIFTTFDSSKGLERKICVVFDFTESYWASRINNPQQSYEILRNIFCVAASRGKNHIIFVKHEEEMLSKETLSTQVETNTNFHDVDISRMFDFKFKESVEECFSLLEITPLHQATNLLNININSKDENIDLSPCIGIYQEAVFFNNYDIDKDIDFHLLLNKDKKFLYDDQVKQSSLDNKILFLVSLETRQNRYRTQVEPPFVSYSEQKQLVARLSSLFERDENVQVKCSIDFSTDDGKLLFSARGFADVVKNETVYELKFVSELTHEHFLQCASYIVALNLRKGILWNTRNNSMYEITVPNKAEFLNAVARTITKNHIKEYINQKQDVPKDMQRIAIIDTETNWNDDVMSIGVIIAESATYEPIAYKYFILKPEFKIGGMFTDSLYINEKFNPIICSRREAISALKNFFNEYGVQSIFAYNANFDFRHLPELTVYNWYDIVRLAAYKQYNYKIPQSAECYKTGRLKRNYGVEPILRMLTDNDIYNETHNALFDAFDELKIMKLLGHEIKTYNCAIINHKKISSDRNNLTDKSVTTPANSKNDYLNKPVQLPQEKNIRKKKKLWSWLFKKNS